MNFYKQKSDFVKFVRINMSQNSLSSSYTKLFLFKFITKSPIIKRFSYCSIALLEAIVSSSEKIKRLLDSGGQYVRKHIHFFLVKVSSENRHSGPLSRSRLALIS